MSQLYPWTTNETLLEFVQEAKQSCRCDGGNSLCTACRAEKYLNANGINPSVENLKFIESRIALANAVAKAKTEAIKTYEVPENPTKGGAPGFYCCVGRGHAKDCPNVKAGHVPAGPESFYRPGQPVRLTATPEPFNKLTPKQVELLSKLAEECGEAVQRIGKILVHGYESYHPHRPEMEDNRKELEKELADIIFMAMRLCDNNDLDRSRISTRAYSKERMERFLQYTHHQGD